MRHFGVAYVTRGVHDIFWSRIRHFLMSHVMVGNGTISMKWMGQMKAKKHLSWQLLYFLSHIRIRRSQKWRQQILSCKLLDPNYSTSCHFWACFQDATKRWTFSPNRIFQSAISRCQRLRTNIKDFTGKILSKEVQLASVSVWNIICQFDRPCIIVH